MGNKTSKLDNDEKAKYRSFPGSAILEKAVCGSIDTTDPDEYQDASAVARLMRRAETLCVSSPVSSSTGEYDSDDNNSLRETPKQYSATSHLFARALVSEVTDNPNTMKHDDLLQREYKLLKAQQNVVTKQAVGKKEQVHVLKSLSLACTGDESAVGCNNDIMDEPPLRQKSAHCVTIGVSLSRKSKYGNKGTITRQTAFDFNQLQDRQYKFVSSTDGWRAGGGEPDGLPDTIHIPIIDIDCPNAEAVDTVISALASGEIFIPHIRVLPESLSVDNLSQTPSLVVKFGCERNDDLNPEEWANWELEFLHNQLYEYFYNLGSVWTKRSFQIVIAKNVRWKTVKHMNRFFANAESVMESWSEAGPQYLDPVSHHLEGGASAEETARPHGIYLFRNGMPTNYFAPNFAPPYSTKMTRSLLVTVLDKSWDKKRREWTNRPIPRLVAPAALVTMACGCTEPNGYMAKEVTTTTTATRSTSTSPVQKQKPERTVSQIELQEEKKENILSSPAPRSSSGRSFAYSSAEEDVRKSKAMVQRLSILSDNDASKTKSVANSNSTTVLHANKYNTTPTSSTRTSPREALQQQKSSSSHRYTMHPNSSLKLAKHHVESAASLEYSTDGSSALFAQDVSLLGQHFQKCDEEESSLVASTSGSENNNVASDQDLLEIGWAKALDPNSGNYYYFTLDRTRTVWDNPLLNNNNKRDP